MDIKALNIGITPTPEYPVMWEGSLYEAIEEFDCRVVRLLREFKGCGRFITTIPISPKDYRENHPTKARVIITEKEEYTEFKIYSDWGEHYKMSIHNSLEQEIQTAIKFARDQNLLT